MFLYIIEFKKIIFLVKNTKNHCRYLFLLPLQTNCTCYLKMKL